MKSTLTTLNKYRNELTVSLLAAGAVSFILINLQAPKSQQDLRNEVSQIETKKAPRRISSKRTALQSLRSKKAPSKKTFEEKMTYTFSKIKKIESCLDGDCRYPDNDPREYSLSVYKDLSLRISRYRNFWAQSWFKISPQDQTYIIGLLEHGNGFVKKEILSLLSSLPKSESIKHLDSVLNNVIDYHDSTLIPKALDLLAKTTNSTNELKVSRRLSRALKNGGPHVSEEISKGIRRFISTKTTHLYKETLPKLPEAAAETTFLTSALTEFEMQQSGG